MADIINPVQKKALKIFLESGYTQLMLDKNNLESKLMYFEDIQVKLNYCIKKFNILGEDVDSCSNGLNKIIESIKNEIDLVNAKINILMTPEFQEIIEIVNNLGN